MDWAKLLQSLLNMVMRRAVQTGVMKGVEMLASKGKTPEEMTPAERQAAKEARKAAKRARQALGVVRRLK